MGKIPLRIKLVIWILGLFDKEFADEQRRDYEQYYANERSESLGDWFK